MGTRIYTFLDTTLTVESKDDSALTWLDEMLLPWFDPHGAATAELALIVRHAPEADRAPLGSPVTPPIRPFLLLDSRVISLPTWCSDHRIVVDDPEEHCRYVLDGLEVIAETGQSGRLGLMRVIREIAVEHERRHARGLEIHAAALELGGSAIVVAGPKSAGKTTLLLHAVTRHSAGLVANDHVLVDAWTGQPRVIGVPAVIRIHPGTAVAFPALGAHRPRGDWPITMTCLEWREALAAWGPANTSIELRLSAAQLTEALPARLQVAAPLQAIVFLEVGGDTLSLVRLSPQDAERRLRANAYGGHGHEDVPTTLTELVSRACPRSQRGDAVAQARTGFAAHLATRVPCFRLVPGPTLGAAADLLVRGALA